MDFERVILFPEGIWDTFWFETHRYAVKLDFSLVEKIEIVQHDPVWVSTSEGQIKIASLWSLSSNIIQKSTKSCKVDQK